MDGVEGSPSCLLTFHPKSPHCLLSMRKWGNETNYCIPVHIHSEREKQPSIQSKSVHLGLGSDSDSNLKKPSNSPSNSHQTSKYLQREESEKDYRDWISFTTGELSNESKKQAQRKSAPAFVKATSLSNSNSGQEILLGPSQSESNRSKPLEESLDSVSSENKVGLDRENGEDKLSLDAAPSANESQDVGDEIRSKENQVEELIQEPIRSNFSSFYDSFKKELSQRPIQVSVPSTSKLSTSTPPARTDLKRKRKLVSPAGQEEDWFISKASKALIRERERNKLKFQEEESQGSVLNQGFEINGLSEISELKEQSSNEMNRCPICSGKLPSPLNDENKLEHERSLGHRLAMDVDKPLPVQIFNRVTLDKREGKEIEKEREPKPKGMDLKRFKLKSNNKGYGLLERMGWKEGMGLGREDDLGDGDRNLEIEEGRRGDRLEVGVEEKHVSRLSDPGIEANRNDLSSTTEKEATNNGSSSQTAIIIHESDEQPETLEQDLNGDELANHSTSTSNYDIPSTSTPNNASTSIKPKPQPTSNRTLEPISIRLKNNRFGLGASKVSEKKTLLSKDLQDEEEKKVFGKKNWTPIRKEELKRQRKGGERKDGKSKKGGVGNGNQRESKRDREKRIEREKREWRDIRGSLG